MDTREMMGVAIIGLMLLAAGVAIEWSLDRADRQEAECYAKGGELISGRNEVFCVRRDALIK